MVLTTVDQIVRNNLMRHGYPLHWYVQSLVFATECLSELTMDDLKIVHTEILPINNYAAADLPNGVNEVTGVFIKVGQMLQPLIESDTINPLNNFDSNLNIIRYDTPQTSQNNSQSVVQIQGLSSTFWYGFAPYDSLGQPTGRFFGIGNPTNKTYRIIKERNQIQLNEGLSVEEIVVQWIGDGRNASAISSVESYALATIRAYIDYRLKDFNRSYSRGEVEQAKQDYFNERRRLRGRKSDLTKTALQQIIYRNSRLSASK